MSSYKSVYKSAMIPPETRERLRQRDIQKGLVREEKWRQRHAGDDWLQDTALAQAFKELGSEASDDDITAREQEIIEKFQHERARALSRGSGYFPPELREKVSERAKVRLAEPEKHYPSAAHNVQRWVTAAGRAAPGAVAGLIGKAQEITEGLPLEESKDIIEADPESNYAQVRALTKPDFPGPDEALIGMVKGGTVAGVPLKGLRKELTKDPTKIWDLVGAAVSGAKKGFLGELDSQDLAKVLVKTREGYEDRAFEQAFSELGSNATDEEVSAKAEEIFGGLVEQDKATYGLKEPGKAQLISEVLFDPTIILPTSWVQKGAKLAKLPQLGKKMAEVSPKLGFLAEAAPRAAAGGILGSMAGDVAAGSTALLAGATKLPGVSKALEEAFTYMPSLRRLGKDGFAGLAAKLRLNREETMAFMTDYSEKVMDVVKQHKLDRNDARLLDDVITGKRLGPLSEKVQRAKDAVDQFLEPHHYAMLRETGAGQLYEKLPQETVEDVIPTLGIQETKLAPKEKIIPAHRMEGYVPREELTPEALAYYRKHKKLPDTRTKLSTDTVEAGAAHHRMGTGAGFVKDPIRQFGAAAKGGDISKGAASLELREMNKALKETGMIAEVETTKFFKGLKQEEYASAIQGQEKALSEFTGTPWVALRYYDKGPKRKIKTGVTLEDVFQLPQAANIGKLRGEKLTFIPKHVADVVEEIGEVVHPSQALSGYQDFMNSFYRKPHTGLKLLWTVGGGPIFFTRNAISGFTLSLQGQGLRSLKYQPAAIAAAFMGSLVGYESKAFRTLMKKKISLRSGEKVRLGDVWDAYMDSGYGQSLQQLHGLDPVSLMGRKSEFRRAGFGQKLETLAGGVPAALTEAGSFFGPAMRRKGKRMGGAAGKTLGVVGGIAESLSPMYWSRAGENYQHFSSFLGFIENTSQAGIAKALDLASEYSANYSRLTKVEKNIIRDWFPFYAWSRFILPHSMKELQRHPNRVANFIRARQYAEQEWGPDRGYSYHEVKPWLRDQGFMLPQKFQPEDKHTYAMGVIETPLIMGVNVAKNLVGLVPGWRDALGEGDRSGIGNVATWATQAAIEMITGRDFRTSEKIDRDVVSVLGRQAKGAIERPSKWYTDMIKFLIDNGQMDEATRMWAGWIAFKQATGAATYLGDYKEEGLRTKSRAQRPVKDMLREYTRENKKRY